MSNLIEDRPADGFVGTTISSQHLVEELRAYHAFYSSLLQRREQRKLHTPIPRIAGDVAA